MGLRVVWSEVANADLADIITRESHVFRGAVKWWPTRATSWFSKSSYSVSKCYPSCTRADNCPDTSLPSS